MKSINRNAKQVWSIIGEFGNSPSRPEILLGWVAVFTLVVLFCQLMEARRKWAALPARRILGTEWRDGLPNARGGSVKMYGRDAGRRPRTAPSTAEYVLIMCVYFVSDFLDSLSLSSLS
mmetsp:Transcript_32213/g.85939  ORF Transcript_32213/g.85939 Transcript_32213/m.85939 type:complete len:119 (+) Transcript_32213:1002-1358(+)